MKVLILDKGTQRFYRSGGKWTERMDEAVEFDNATDAMKVCEAERLRATIILDFPDSGHQLEIPCGGI